MKKQIAIASAIIAASSYSFAEIVLTESLSVEGFVDMSWSDIDNAASEIGLDQVEFNFLFSAGAVNAQVDIEYEEDDAGANIEQAFVSYDLGNGAVVTAGRMASQLGFEDFEPTGLYQVTNAVSTRNLPGYDQGVKVTYGDFGIAVVHGVTDGRIADNGGYSIEVAYSRELTEGLNGFVGARFNQTDVANGDTSVINAYVTYVTGALLLAAEVAINDGTTDADDVTDYQLMANYSYSDKASVTVRYAVAEDSSTGITLAHNYALADNLALIAEVGQIDPDADGVETLTGAAVELLFTF